MLLYLSRSGGRWGWDWGGRPINPPDPVPICEQKLCKDNYCEPGTQRVHEGRCQRCKKRAKCVNCPKGYGWHDLGPMYVCFNPVLLDPIVPVSSDPRNPVPSEPIPAEGGISAKYLIWGGVAIIVLLLIIALKR